MALEAEKFQLREDIPPGEMASKVIKAVHQDTRRRMFPTDTLYGREDGDKRSLKKSIVVYLSPETRDNRVLHSHVPKEKPIEKRDFSQPSKAFRTWVIPRKFSSCERDRPTITPKPLHRSLSALTSTKSEIKSLTPAYEEIHSPRISTSNPAKREDKVILPRLNKTSHHPVEKPLMPRTYSAAQQWMIKYSDRDKYIKQMLKQCNEAKIDRILMNIEDGRARQNLRKWFDESSAQDRSEAIKFLTSTSNPGQDALKMSRRLRSSCRTQEILQILTAKKKKEAPSIEHFDRKRRVRLLSQATRMRMGEFQTWHHMPGYPAKSRVENSSSMFVVANHGHPKTFRIHPEWA